nr:hypothetical protein [Halorubrum sp. PV6]
MFYLIETQVSPGDGDDRVAEEPTTVLETLRSREQGGPRRGVVDVEPEREPLVGTVLPMVGFIPGYYRFTRREKPLPAVVTMVLVAAGSTIGWGLAATGAVTG